MPKLNVIAGIIDKVADNVDRFTLDKEEKAQLIAEINKAQLEVNKVEARHTSIFVAGWRPFIGWTCGVALCYHFVLQPFFTFFIIFIWIPNGSATVRYEYTYDNITWDARFGGYAFIQKSEEISMRQND